jgi:uncharacterized protein (TIGR03083 family)
MGDVGEGYRALRRRVRALTAAAEPAALEALAPATPAWRVRDLLAHMVGVARDVVDGRTEGIATDAWTGAQVAARRSLSSADVLAEWDEYGPRFEALLDAAPFAVAGQALYDAVTHECDLRHALGVPAGPPPELALAWGWYLPARDRGGAAPLRFLTEHGEEHAGGAPPVATVAASRFELFRAATGRRTAAEIASYGWDGPPRPELLRAAPIFTMRTEPLGEAVSPRGRAAR